MKTKFLLIALLITVASFGQDYTKYGLIEDFITKNIINSVPDFTMNEDGTIHFFQVTEHDFNILSAPTPTGTATEIIFNATDKLIFNNSTKAANILNAFKEYYKYVKSKVDEKTQLDADIIKYKQGILF